MKAILLLSGGIDSPVAGYLMKQRGVELIGLHLITQKTHDKKIEELAKKISITKLFIINISELQKTYMLTCNTRFQCLFCKRTMLRLAEQLAKKEKADFIVTGESLGQVASQTLTNLTVLDKAVKMTIARPLLSFDKEETIKIARDIGTYDISTQKEPPCAFLPTNPSTRAKLEKVEIEEQKLDISSMLNNALDDAEMIKLK